MRLYLGIDLDKCFLCHKEIIICPKCTKEDFTRVPCYVSIQFHNNLCHVCPECFTQEASEDIINSLNIREEAGIK